MSQRRHGHIPPRRLLAYLEGEVTGSERAAIEADLGQSETLRAQLADARELLDDFRQPERIEALDLVPSLHAQIQAPQRGRSKGRPDRSRRWLPLPWTLALASAGLAAAAVVALVPLFPSETTAPPGDDEFRVKSAAPAGQRARNWVRLEAYRVRDGGQPERVDRRLRVDDGLLFAYANPGPNHYTHLLVFAVDGAGEVYWFYPAHVKAGANPTSVPIRRTRLGTELPELIRHDFRPGPLAIYGVFSKDPVDVASVEAAVAARRRAGTWDVTSPSRLALAKTVQRIVDVTVYGQVPGDATD